MRFSPPPANGSAICRSRAVAFSDNIIGCACTGGSPMTPNHSESNQSRSDRSDHDPAVNRREFLGMTAASLLMAGSLSGATKPDAKPDTRPDTRNGIPYRTLGRSGEKVSVIGLGGYHLGNQSDPEES